MTEMKFHVGDRVVAVKTPFDISNDQIPAGSSGTVVKVVPATSAFLYWVNWDHAFRNGYVLRDYNNHYIPVTEDKHGWKVNGSCIELYDIQDFDVSGAVSADALERFMSLA